MTLSQTIYSYLNSGDYASARNIVKTELAKLESVAGDKKILAQSEFYGYLIDIGSESRTEDDLNKAINFLKANQDLLSTDENRPYYYYNLANAVNASARIFYFNNRGIHPLDVQKARFQESIQYYWTALNAVTKDQSLRKQ